MNTGKMTPGGIASGPKLPAREIRSNLESMRDMIGITQALRSLPERLPCPDLRIGLQVIASRERQRRLNRLTLSARLRTFKNRFDLLCEDLVRPLALPFAGGVFSTILLFSMFVVPAYPLRSTSTVDVPTVLTTQVSVKGVAPFSAADEDVIVDVSVDSQGRMIDYAIVAGASVLANAEMRRRLENTLLFTEFTPATAFGQPTPAKMRLWFRSSHIDVKG